MFRPVSKVLDDDNLLIEIIVRLGFPTTLVRASLVCKRWFRHASNPAFLRRFRKLHPPRPLGFYIESNHRLFFMLPQPPELAAVARRAASYRFYACPNVWIGGCRNGRILIRFNYKSTFGAGPSSSTRRIQFGVVCSPLCPERAVPIIPQPPREPKNSRRFTFFKQDGHGLYHFWFFQDQEKIVAHVYMFKDGVWSMHTSAATHFPYCYQPYFLKPLLVGNKIYIPSFKNDILVLDLRASSFSKIQLPHGVEYGEMDTFSPDDDDSTVYLIHARKFQLHIWLSNEDNWLLVDVICLRGMYANLRMSDHTCEDDYTVHINYVGENAEFASD